MPFLSSQRLWYVASFVLLYTRGDDSSDATNNAHTTSHDSNNAPTIDDRCTLYLAPSTIPGAGLGIFSAIERHVGDAIGDPAFGLGTDGCIPVVDLYWHTARINDEASLQKKIPKKLFNPLVHYFWDGHTMGMHTESRRHDIEAFCPGLDCAINCHLALVNVDKAMPQYSEVLENDSPGAGAHSPYSNSTSRIVRPVPAGGELFKYYGDNWFVVRSKTFGADLALMDDYPAAQRLLQRFHALVTTKTKTAPPRLATDLYKLILALQPRFASRRLNALPKRLDQALQAAVTKDGIAHVVHQPQHVVSTKLLHRTGVCWDRIAVRPSQLPQAGHGAFATRALLSGTVITTSPVHHIPSYPSWFAMYNFTKLQNPAKDTDDYQHWIRLVDERNHWQLLYNYCYGVPDSTLRLCPYGSGVNYINHHSNWTNVRLAWPTLDLHWMHNHSAVSHGTLHDLTRSTKPQLALSYVATRDIFAGDELYMDYGADWEHAWDEHVATYESRRSRAVQPRHHVPWHGTDEVQPDVSGRRYASAHQWNRDFGTASIRTHQQQDVDPYPSHLQLRCHRTLWRHVATVVTWQAKDYGLPCRILDRFVETSNASTATLELYTVQLEWQVDEYEEDEEGEYDDLDDMDETTVTWRQRTDVPRSAIRFFDVPYSTDIHQSFAFRHEIGIPDDMFPPQWRNL